MHDAHVQDFAGTYIIVYHQLSLKLCLRRRLCVGVLGLRASTALFLAYLFLQTFNIPSIVHAGETPAGRPAILDIIDLWRQHHSQLRPQESPTLILSARSHPYTSTLDRCARISVVVTPANTSKSSSTSHTVLLAGSCKPDTASDLPGYPLAARVLYLGPLLTVPFVIYALYILRMHVDGSPTMAVCCR